MTPENLLKDVLNDEELKAKYKLSDAMIDNARLSAPYEHPIIEYLAGIIISSMDQHLAPQSVYNKIKNIIKIS
jgi:hypothetical protein